jgi:hypothetical protein
VELAVAVGVAVAVAVGVAVAVEVGEGETRSKPGQTAEGDTLDMNAKNTFKGIAQAEGEDQEEDQPIYSPAENENVEFGINNFDGCDGRVTRDGRFARVEQAP